MRALVIEDQAFIRSIVVQILDQVGFRGIDQAADGGEGLLLSSMRTYDVIVCDIDMKPVTGLEFLTTLREREKEASALRATPVLFLTSHSDEETIVTAKETGVNAYLLKPPSVQALKSKIDFLLRTAAST